MNDKVTETTLVGFICSPFLNKVTNTPFFGKPYIKFIDYNRLISHIYMIGAILGLTRHDKLHKLAKLFLVHGTTSKELYNFISLSRKGAYENLENFKKESGKEPETFYEYIFIAQIRRLLEAKNISLNPEYAIEAYESGDKTIAKYFDMRVDLNDAKNQVGYIFVQGVCFGSIFPKLTETMYREARDNDYAEFEILTKGLVIPDEVKITSLEEVEKAFLQIVAQFTSKYYPELIGPLDLSIYLESSNRVG